MDVEFEHSWIYAFNIVFSTRFVRHLYKSSSFALCWTFSLLIFHNLHIISHFAFMMLLVLLFFFLYHSLDSLVTGWAKSTVIHAERDENRERRTNDKIHLINDFIYVLAFADTCINTSTCMHNAYTCSTLKYYTTNSFITTENSRRRYCNQHITHTHTIYRFTKYHRKIHTFYLDKCDDTI